ncbi:hypothetical protein [Paenibacillus pabuli]|uniref:hypothetical protein n=1 Tax=Paenibacillus pabuli TaxID=1472 RepID=UPI000784B9B1|nr:hypothetical protein [Paenibacillus pabuli]MEC0124565.1 hypothetical protein [Paenibacillus pabuli]
MKKKSSITKFISVIITLLLFVAGCSSEKQPVEEVNPTEVQTIGTQTHEYLSITNTEYVNGTDTNDGMIMRVYTYDIQNKALTKMADLPYNSQYPLTVASLAEDTIYYSGAGKDKGDELFSYDIKTQNIQQLSSDLFAINSIIPDTVDHTLVMAAVKKGERPVKVIFFDKETQEMTILNDDDSDTTTWDISYDPETSKSYAIQYSEEEQYNHMEESNKTQTPMVPPNHTIIEIDPISKQTRKVIELHEEQILTLSTRGDEILIATAKHINKYPIKYSIVNIKTGQRKEIDLPIKASSELFLSKDGNGFYFLGEKGNGNNERGIYYYDLKTQEVEGIFLQKEGFINNFMLLSNPIN